jgi:hypothetical protein
MFPISPPIVLSIVIASIYAALFSLWRNGSPRDLVFYLFAGWVGFAIGQAAGWLIHFNWGMIGNVYLIEGTIFCWLLLFLMQWLRMPRGKSPGH